MSVQEDFITPRSLSPHGHAVLHTLVYFDVFRHPLTLDELFRYCQWDKLSLSETAAATEELLNLGLIKEQSGYYFLDGHDNLVTLRKEKNERALRYWKKAEKWSSFISGFPFVRAVSVSGSLSKGTMDKKGDIDYFIITEPGRLWVARTFLVIFKKLFLLNSKRFFCVNYFIDTNNLSIPDRNLFTATEIAFVRPMTDQEDIFSRFQNENHWVSLFYPNKERPSSEQVSATRKGWTKRTTESLLKGNFGEWLDEQFFRITLSRWKKKFPHVNEQNFEIDFRSRKHVSKHHPQGFQRIVLGRIEEKMMQLEEKHRLKIVRKTMEWNHD